MSLNLIFVFLTVGFFTALSILMLLSYSRVFGQKTRHSFGAVAALGSSGQKQTSTTVVANEPTNHPTITAMQDAVKNAPFLIWQQEFGEVLWGNTAYQNMVAMVYPDIELDQNSLPMLFTDPMSLNGVEKTSSKRLSTPRPNGQSPMWFDVSAYPERHSGHLYFAQHANPVVQAEDALRNFVQTLTKTFAHLPIGLAIFDRQRQLALFNPALADLTNLKPEWLSQRPSLFSFLDQLRETRQMPDLKDYPSWRRNMVALEKEAEDGTYSEHWALASGQTFHVSGRPHPEGAVAFLFEDISASISLQRQFRSELELCQAVIDNIQDALIVFSAGGDLAMSNDAFAEMWGIDPARMLGRATVIDISKTWQSLCKPTPIWGDIRDFVSQLQDRSERFSDIELLDGTAVSARIFPISGGATLCSFSSDLTHSQALVSLNIKTAPIVENV